MSRIVSTVYKNSEEQKGMMILLYAFYTFLGAFGTIMSFSSSFRFGKGVLFYLVPVVIVVAVSMVLSEKNMLGKALIFLGIGIAAFMYIKFDDLAGSFITTANIFINDINESYYMGLNMLVYPEFVGDYKSVEMFLLLVIIIVAALISFFVVGYPSIIGSILVSLPISLAGVFFDRFPELIYLIMAVMFWGLTVALRASGRTAGRRFEPAAYNALMVVCMICIIFAISQSVMPEDEYVRKDLLNDVKRFINEEIAQVTAKTDEIDAEGEESGIGNGKFGSRDKITFSGHKMLEVDVPLLDKNIYIRAKEFNEYNRNSWEHEPSWFSSFYRGTYSGFRSELEMAASSLSYAYVDKDMYPQNFTSSIVKQSGNMLGMYSVSPAEYLDITDEYTITVRNVAEKGYMFAPYGAAIDFGEMEQDVLTAEGGFVEKTYDVYTADVDKFLEKFSMATFSNMESSVDELLLESNEVQESMKLQNYIELLDYIELRDYEDMYASYVRKAYTQVPDELKEPLKKYAPNMVGYEYKDIMAFVEQIRQMFNSEYSYTLAPGRVPEDKDGILYFLEENKKGYCVYFASAAALIFRTAGIPARYVEGYIVTPDMASINLKYNMGFRRTVGDEYFRTEKEYVTVTVPDNKAHAWTEIYIAGYGWIPIEMTPGYYVGSGTVSKNDENQTEETVSREIESTSKQNENIAQHNNQNVKADSDLLKVLLVLAATFAVVGILVFVCAKWYFIRGKKLRQLFYGVDISEKQRACLAWWYIENVMAFLGKKIPDNISLKEQKAFLKDNTEFFSKNDLNGTIEYITKAYYGNENLTNEEVISIVTMAKDFRRDVYESLPAVKRFYFKYIKRL